MNFWIDAQLPPSLANWLVESFNVNATAIRDLGLRDAEDIEIFNAASEIGKMLCQPIPHSPFPNIKNVPH